MARHMKTWGPKPPVAPKPRLLYEPEEKRFLHSRRSLHQCRSGGLILSEDDLDQENEPGGFRRGLEEQVLEDADQPQNGEDPGMELFYNLENNGTEEEGNVKEEEEKLSKPVSTEAADSEEGLKLCDIDCSIGLVDPMGTTDMECRLDIESESCGAGEALADTDGLLECDIASYHEAADHYSCETKNRKVPENLGTDEDYPPGEMHPAKIPNIELWYVKDGDKSSDHEECCPRCPSPCNQLTEENEDSFVNAHISRLPSLCEECSCNVLGAACNLCEHSEDMDNQHNSPTDGELVNAMYVPDNYQYSEGAEDIAGPNSASDTESTTEEVNDMDSEGENEGSSKNCTGKQSAVSEEQSTMNSITNPDDCYESHPNQDVIITNLFTENTPEGITLPQILEEKRTMDNCHNEDDDSLCQDEEDLHQIECVSSEDYVEIGDDDEDEIDTREKKAADINCNEKGTDACLEEGSIQSRYRLCSISVPVDMDMRITPELTDTLVFTNTAEVFGEDIDIEGHIVPYFEDTDREQDNISDEHVYEVAGLDTEGENFQAVDRKNIVTRSRSLSGKVPGCVPETVPEETGAEETGNEYCTVALAKSNHPGTDSQQHEKKRIIPSCKPQHFIFYPRSISVEGRDLTMSVYEDNISLGEQEKRKNNDNISLPFVMGSSGSFSQRNRLPSSGVSTPTSVVDIPPPFELAYITKKPITKSSPSLLIENDSTEKQKKKSSFKRFLMLKFRRKRENKVHLDVNVSSSRSSSESSHHGPVRLLDMDRRSVGSSPQPVSRFGKPQRSSDSPTTFLFYKDGRRKGGPKTFTNKRLSRVESFEDQSRPPFTPLPLMKPRSISFPNADTSDYENMPAISSDYENIQIPQRPTGVGMFAEFFDDPCRALSAANENDGYVDMSSFAGFESKTETPQQEPDRRGHTEPEAVCQVSTAQTDKAETEEDQGRTSEEEDGGAERSHDRQGDGRSRAFYIAKELVDSEKVHVNGLKLLQEDFRATVAAAMGADEEPVLQEEKLSEILGPLPEVYQLHCHILAELEDHLRQWEESQRIADVFLSRRAEFAIFTPYITQYDRRVALLDETCQSSPTFSSIVKQFESLAGGKLTLKHQLLQVVLRVLKYRMILTDYLNNLSPDSKEYEDTQAVLSIVSEAADRANDGLKHGENLLRLVHIEHSVTSQRDLLQPGRVFVKEGTLMKVSRKSRQPRHLFLMNDLLLYTFPQQDGKYRLKNTLPLTGMKVSKPILENVQNALKIEVTDISITLSSSSCGERDEWFHALSRTVESHGRGQGASRNPSSEAREKVRMSLGETAPTLVPVSHVMMCMNCASDFSLMLRRHHCHACGKIICRGCSRNKYPLKYLKDRMAKVCDRCYAELKKQGGAVDDVRGSASPRISRSSRPLSAVFQNIHPPNLWRSRKTTATFNQVTVEPEGSAIPGTTHCCKRSKRNWKRLWFLIKDKDKIATESLPLLGFTLKLPDTPEAGDTSSNIFQLYHKKALYCTITAEDSTVPRWINAIEEATVL
nr:FYVE, RhoGEF and PH domain-containing protein 5-like isoform X1 [Paramormyrops kingsleyae]XP_023661296.1 FYVE, RhoGEF and PH domain-containing protein 5-like isoform X1 [Paramormyrops kingsleyae]